MIYNITFNRANWVIGAGPRQFKGTYEEFVEEVNELGRINGFGPTWVDSAVDKNGKECKSDFYAKSDYGFIPPLDHEL